MTVEEHMVLWQAVGRWRGAPERLAYYLADYPLAELCERLGCPEEAALRLQLFHTPDVYEWLRSIRIIAATLEVPVDQLALLLREAVGRQQGTVMSGG